MVAVLHNDEVSLLQQCPHGSNGYDLSFATTFEFHISFLNQWRDVPAFSGTQLYPSDSVPHEV